MSFQIQPGFFINPANITIMQEQEREFEQDKIKKKCFMIKFSCGFEMILDMSDDAADRQVKQLVNNLNAYIAKMNGFGPKIVPGINLDNLNRGLRG